MDQSFDKVTGLAAEAFAQGAGWVLASKHRESSRKGLLVCIG
jgi:hypothetical protein